MRKIEIVPLLGSSDASDKVPILRWIRSQGISVKHGDALIQVETDKVNVDVQAPEYGRLIQVSAQEGDL